MKNFKITSRFTDNQTIAPERKTIERQIKNKLVLVRSFIDEKQAEIQQSGSIEKSAEIIDLDKTVNQLDLIWHEWNERTMSAIKGNDSDLELIRSRVHWEMIELLDRIERIDN